MKVLLYIEKGSKNPQEREKSTVGKANTGERHDGHLNKPLYRVYDGGKTVSSASGAGKARQMHVNQRS